MHVQLGALTLDQALLHETVFGMKRLLKSVVDEQKGPALSYLVIHHNLESTEVEHAAANGL